MLVVLTVLRLKVPRGRSSGRVPRYTHTQRRGGSQNNGDVLQDSGSLCTTLRKRILGTDRRFDETPSKFSEEMLLRIDRRVHSTRRGRGMDLPKKRGST